MAGVKKYVLDRLKEASTYRGLVWLLTALGVAISPELSAAIATFGAGLAGLLAVVLPG